MSVAPCRPKKNEFCLANHWLTKVLSNSPTPTPSTWTTLGMSCFLLLRYSSQKRKNSLQNVFMYIYIYIHVIYIIITMIQRSAVFRRSDIHPATCTLPSLRQAPAVFSFCQRDSHLQHFSKPFAMILGLTLSSS